MRDVEVVAVKLQVIDDKECQIHVGRIKRMRYVKSASELETSSSDWEEQKDSSVNQSSYWIHFST